MSFRGDDSVTRYDFPRLGRVLPHLSHLLHPESLIWMQSQRHKAATKQLELCTGQLLLYGAARPDGRCSEGKAPYSDLRNIAICSAAATS
jgi:hypothetical protein